MSERARKVWRAFWYVGLTVHAALSAWAVYAYVNQGLQGMVLVTLVISVWTMWTSDLPNGKVE